MNPTLITAIGAVILSAITGIGGFLTARPKDKATAVDTLAGAAGKLVDLAATQNQTAQAQHALDMSAVRAELAELRAANETLVGRVSDLEAGREVLRRTVDAYGKALDDNDIPRPVIV